MGIVELHVAKQQFCLSDFHLPRLYCMCICQQCICAGRDMARHLSVPKFHKVPPCNVSMEDNTVFLLSGKLAFLRKRVCPDLC